MKRDVGIALKERGRPELFTESNFGIVREVMKLGMKEDEWLNMYLNLDPLNKVDWIADHIVKLYDAGHLKK